MPGLYYFSLFMVIAIMIGMTCFYKKCRAYPLNYILLGTYTVFHTYLIGAMSTFYTKETVMVAAIATMLMFITLTVYAVFTKTDMTKFGGLMCVGSVMMVFFIIIVSMFNVPSIVGVVLICVMIALMSMWIVYDTQLIVGGNKY
jgi:FtsH-binding integral membrane protein